MIEFNKPEAINRLGDTIFVSEKARKLDPSEYEIILDDPGLCGKNFAITLDPLSGSIITYADRQADKTDISLSGNCGSGRAVYYGDRYNILGVGKTSLCMSTKPSHSTGRIELIGAMRRVIVSNWINQIVPGRAPKHPVLIALKEERKYKWNSDPIPSTLLVRVDEGSLDRPSHIEFNSKIPIDFKNILTEYVKIDAEYLSYRMMLGAWSNGNYSIRGQIIDIETVSFVRFRAPYYTSTSKYVANLFGYEGHGFISILKQLAAVKNIPTDHIEIDFWKERQRHLSTCFLKLIGIDVTEITSLNYKYLKKIHSLSIIFESLSKKISSCKSILKTYVQIPEESEPSLLDMSRLFRNLSTILTHKNREDLASDLLIRKHVVGSILNLKSCDYKFSSNKQTSVHNFITCHATISNDKLDNFLQETRGFIRDLLLFLDVVKSDGYLTDTNSWYKRLQRSNFDLPTMFELNTILARLTERYRDGSINATELGHKIRNLSNLPS